MDEVVKLAKGGDWCNVQIAKDCSGGAPTKCLFLGDQVRVCSACLLVISKEEFPDDYQWVLEKASHPGLCEIETVELSSGEEVSFCPKCFGEVVREYDLAIFDWVLSFHKEARHTEARRSGRFGWEDSLACRECLLIVLSWIDRPFFDLVTTARGKALVERLTLCKCECHGGGSSWEGVWSC